MVAKAKGRFPAILALFGYQLAWLLDFNRLKIICKARQIGITFTETLSIVQRLMVKRQRWYYLSISEERAKEAIDYATNHLKVMGLAIGDYTIEEGYIPHPYFKGIKYKQLTIVFPNGSRLIGLPANPVTARGCSGNVTLDEFGHHHDAAKIWEAVFPVTTWGYCLHVISTPNGNQGKYCALWTNNGAHQPNDVNDLAKRTVDVIADGWSRHSVDIMEASSQGHPVDIEKCRALAGNSETFAQEYMCQFLDEAFSWLPYSLLDRRTHAECSIVFDHTQAPAGPLYLGGDIGRKRDLTVFWINEVRNHVAHTRGVIALKNTPLPVQQRQLGDLIPLCRRAGLDRTGIGTEMTERMQKRFGKLRVEGYNFTGDTPAQIATKLKNALEEDAFWIPDDPDVRKDLHAVRRTYTDLGKQRFEAPRTKDGHADRFWAAGLAIAVAEDAAPPLKTGDIESIGSRRDWGDFC